MPDLKARKDLILKANGTLNPHTRRVHDALFHDAPFFDPRDLLQVKYEMLRTHINLNPAVVLTRAKDLAPLCNCGLRFRRAQGALAGSADGHAGTDAVLH